MNFELLHQKELQLLAKLQEIRSPLLDKLMIACNFFDSSTFYFLLIPAIWFFYQRKLGIQLFYLAIAAWVLTQWLKAFFQEPRPCSLMPQFALLFSTTYGFPSGAALTTSAVFGYMAFQLKKCWFSLFAILFVLLIGFSRVYLGLHFLSDVVGGYFFGMLLLAAYWKSFLYLDKKRWGYALIAFLFLALFIFEPEMRSWLSVGFGITIGLMQDLSVPKETDSVLVQAFSFIASLVPFFLVQALPISQEIKFLLFVLCGAWISFGIPYVKEKVIQH